MLETIICSAIWYKQQPTSHLLPINVDCGVVVCGHRHPHCIYTFVALTGKRSVLPECGEYIQGFLTNTNRFVNRKEAYYIALNANQILNLNTVTIECLYSEDIY